MLKDLELFIERMIEQHGVLRVVTAPLVVVGVLATIGVSTASAARVAIIQIALIATVLVVVSVLALRNRSHRLEARRTKATAIRFADRVASDLDYEIVQWDEVETFDKGSLSVTRTVHLRATTERSVVLCWQRQMGPNHKSDLTERERRAVSFQVLEARRLDDGTLEEGSDLMHLVDWRGKDAWIYVDLQGSLTAPAEKILVFKTEWQGYREPFLDREESYERTWLWRRPVHEFSFELRLSESLDVAGLDLRYSSEPAMSMDKQKKDGYTVLRVSGSQPPAKHAYKVSCPTVRP